MSSPCTSSPRAVPPALLGRSAALAASAASIHRIRLCARLGSSRLHRRCSLVPLNRNRVDLSTWKSAQAPHAAVQRRRAQPWGRQQPRKPLLETSRFQGGTPIHPPPQRQRCGKCAATEAARRSTLARGGLRIRPQFRSQGARHVAIFLLSSSSPRPDRRCCRDRGYRPAALGQSGAARSPARTADRLLARGGLLLVPYVVFVAGVGMRARIARGPVWAVIVAHAAWAVASIG